MAWILCGEGNDMFALVVRSAVLDADFILGGMLHLRRRFLLF
ncbi:hypothetical protein RFF05_12450 [Bengtsoniella intestinalis]